MGRRPRAFAAVAIFAALVALLSASCQKRPVKDVRKIDPDFERLHRVLSAMSPECKAAVPNGSPSEFLSDLRLVLADDRDGLLVLCDKSHPLPDGYEPPDLVELSPNESYNVEKKGLLLRAPAETALRTMGAAARLDGVTLLASSTYRSFSRQEEVYGRLVEEEGQEAADRESARPGTSQHQTGAAVDFGSIDDSFADTKPGRWLSAHAANFGWSLSFPDGYEGVTGYRHECWHYRYVGVAACRFQKKWFGDVQQFMLEFLDKWREDAAG